MEKYQAKPQVYEFGPFRLDAEERLLTRAGAVVPLPPKVFDTLLALVEHAGRLLTKDELIRLLWPDSFVEEGSLTRNVSYLRKALGDGATGESQFIETVPKRGYRFSAPVRSAPATEVELAAARAERTWTESAPAQGGTVIPTNGAFHAAPSPAWPAPALTPTSLPTSPPTSTTTFEPVVRCQSAKLKRLFALTAVCALAALAVGWVYFARASRSAAEPVLSPAHVRVSKLTNTGQYRFPALSPDGKYLAQVLDDGRRQSIQVRQLETSNSVEIVPPAEVRYRGLTFARDNGSIYFVAYEGSGHIGMLARVPVLGGVAQRLGNDVDSPVALSPDGRQLAFLRSVPSQGESVLVVANADGSAERRVATRRNPQPFLPTGPAWSPDGQQLACVVRDVCDGVAVMDVLVFNLRDGATAKITQQTPGQRWVTIGQLCWTRADALLAVAWREPTYTFADQLWLLSTRGGNASQITNDANSYTGVSASADGQKVVTTQFTRTSNLYVAPDDQPERGTPVSTSLLGNAGVNPGLAWTPDGRLVFGSTASGHPDLWLMNADGSARRPLTDDIYTDLQPAVSPAGQTLAFISWRNGQQGLWQMDLASQKLQLLAKGAGDTTQSFSPDGKWLVYDALEAGTPTLWMMPVGGGTSVRLTTFYSWKPVVSPDGRWLACYYLEAPSTAPKLALLPFQATPTAEPATQPTRVLGEVSSPDRATLQWTPDSQALVYNLTRAGVSNLWRQPVAGGPAQQWTHFTEDRLFNFAVARDGRLAYERGKLLSDTVLLTAH